MNQTAHESLLETLHSDPAKKQPFPAEHLWTSWIGKKVSKAKKPFKSGSKVNTITGITINEKTGNEAFTFAEDESVVDCWKCIPIEDKPEWNDSPEWAKALAYKCEYPGVWCWMAGTGPFDGFIGRELRPVPQPSGNAPTP